jgi:putative DNA primase/helicase
MPQSVRDRFVQVNEKFYFENEELAFRDLGNKLTTRSENAEVVRSFVEIAQARGWDEIKIVSGTTDFRRAVWLEAALNNISVRGYAPTEIDEGRLVRTLARRRDIGRTPEHENEIASAQTREAKASARVTHAARSEKNPEPRAADHLKRVHFGTLLAHGADNYRFSPHEDVSYFVKLRDDDGQEHTLWGKDLERALRDSKSAPKIGDRIGISHAGQEAVTVSKQERDQEGRVLREYELKTHRNDWTIETAAFFQERAKLAEMVRDPSIDAVQAVERNPALAGTYAALRGAELHAKKHFEDPHQQARFVETIRRTLAREIHEGEPLYQTTLRNRERSRESPGVRSPANLELAPLR